MKGILLLAAVLFFGIAVSAQPSASVETLMHNYAGREGALVMRLDSTMIGLVKLRMASLPDSLQRGAVRNRRPFQSGGGVAAGDDTTRADAQPRRQIG